MGDHSVVSASNDIKKRFADQCFKRGVHQQTIVDRLLTEWLEKTGASDSTLKVAEYLNLGKECVSKLDEVKNLLSKVNTYDGYSDSNWKYKEASLREKGAPEEDVALAKRVYALEKRRAHTAKDALTKAIEILEQEPTPERNEEKPKWGHPPKATRLCCPACGSMYVVRKAYRPDEACCNDPNHPRGSSRVFKVPEEKRTGEMILE